MTASAASLSKIYSLSEIFNNPDNCFPAFANPATSSLTHLVGRFVTAFSDEEFEHAAALVLEIQERFRGACTKGIADSFRSFIDDRYGVLFATHGDLEPRVLAGEADSATALQFYVMSAAMVVQERDEVARAYQMALTPSY